MNQSVTKMVTHVQLQLTVNYILYNIPYIKDQNSWLEKKNMRKVDWIMQWWFIKFINTAAVDSLDRRFFQISHFFSPMSKFN